MDAGAGLAPARGIARRRSAERVVVVGAGLGGLTAAAELAARGADVVLCEAAEGPGGKARETPVLGRGVAAGPTVLTMRWVFEALFETLGTRLDAHLNLTRADTLARHAWPDGTRLDLFADPARSEAAIAAFAGGAEAARFRAFSERARALFETFAPVFIEADKPSFPRVVRALGPDPRLLHAMGYGASMWRALGATFRDPRLRMLFARYATYVGGAPGLTPAMLLLIWHAEQSGVWLVEGGVHRLARVLADLARAHGAEVRHGAPVAEILVEGGRAAGVRLASGERIAAGAVVFNGDVGALAEGRLGAAATGAVRPVARRARSLSALTLCMVAEPRGWPLAHHTVVFGSDSAAGYAAEFREITRERRLPTAPTVYLCAQDRGADDIAPPGPERLLAIINAPADGDLPGARACQPEEITACQTRALTALARSGLTLSPPDGGVTATSPAGFETRFPATGGALYGRAPHSFAASFLRAGARSRLPGLYLTGGSVHPGPGVPMATLSGRAAVRAWMADRASTCASTRTATSGGTSTASATTAPTPSP